jgi:hypothetical protein
MVKRRLAGNTNDGDHLPSAFVDDDLNAFYQHIRGPGNVLCILVSSRYGGSAL